MIHTRLPQGHGKSHHKVVSLREKVSHKTGRCARKCADGGVGDAFCVASRWTADQIVSGKTGLSCVFIAAASPSYETRKTGARTLLVGLKIDAPPNGGGAGPPRRRRNGGGRKKGPGPLQKRAEKGAAPAGPKGTQVGAGQGPGGRNRSSARSGYGPLGLLRAMPGPIPGFRPLMITHISFRRTLRRGGTGAVFQSLATR